jgi:hypothetical protein
VKRPSRPFFWLALNAAASAGKAATASVFGAGKPSRAQSMTSDLLSTISSEYPIKNQQSEFINRQSNRLGDPNHP